MSWSKPSKSGWQSTGAQEPVSRFTQVIRTILEVVPGGVIRYGKTSPDDDTRTGFWLGVTTDGVARLSVGGPSFWLKWDGAALQVCGYIVIPGNPDDTTWLTWRGIDGAACGYIHALDAGGWHIMELGTPIPHLPGGRGMLDLVVDGDLGKQLRFRLLTERGRPAAEQKLALLVGNVESFYIDGNANAWLGGRFAAAPALDPGELVNLGQADGRYLPKSAGLTGTFALAPGKTLTFTAGQLTATEGF